MDQRKMAEREILMTLIAQEVVAVVKAVKEPMEMASMEIVVAQGEEEMIHIGIIQRLVAIDGEEIFYAISVEKRFAAVSTNVRIGKMHY